MPNFSKNIRMKKNIISILFLLSVLAVFSQKNEFKYLCKFKCAFQRDSLNPQSKFTDIMYLNIFLNYSEYYSFLRQTGLKNMYSDMTGGVPLQNASKDRSRYYDKNESEVLTYDFKTKNLKVVDMLTSSTFCYEEKHQEPLWDIKQDTMSILNQLCQKAITTYKGRSYIAWFTNAIPYNIGPWQFTGLPGLILKVTDTQNQFEFECIELINSPKIENPIFFMYNDCKKTITKNRLKDLKKLKATDYMEFARQTMGVSVTDQKTGLEIKKPIKPYNPLDLTN